VQQFLKVFVDIVLWRRGPQDLPSSKLLVGATLAVYVLVSLLQLAFIKKSSTALYLVVVFVDPVLLMGWVWLVLRIFGHPERYQQSVAAVLGTSALLGLALALPAQLLIGVDEPRVTTLTAELFTIALFVVFVLVSGRIVQLATESTLFTGVAIMSTYVFVSYVLMAQLVGAGAAAPAGN
jgi:hypothetical protein